MEALYQILGLLGDILIVFFLYRTIKTRPELFSKEKLNKSFYTLGLLGLGLIAFVAFLIWMVRNT